MDSIQELLESMQTRYKGVNKGDNIRNLQNNRSTWERIGAGDAFIDLGFSNNEEKDSFLRDWISSNPYSNLD